MWGKLYRALLLAFIHVCDEVVYELPARKVLHRLLGRAFLTGRALSTSNSSAPLDAFARLGPVTQINRNPSFDISGTFHSFCVS
jgi:hypothetical protein